MTARQISPPNRPLANSQRLARMRDRRAMRLAPKLRNGPPAPETLWTLSVDASRLGSAREAVRAALREIVAPYETEEPADR